MKKIIIALLVLLSVASCKGPGSGPLVKESFSKTDQGRVKSQNMDGKTHMGQITIDKVNVVVEPAAGCVTIAKLLENKQSFAGQVIRVKGQVTKYNPQIMGKNWVHIQDGTEFNGGFDLTITTEGNVVVGETVIFEGKLALDKDFGYGYSYNVLLEEAKLVR
jgi:hypothetical protein